MTASDQAVTLLAYSNLIKASWILIDVITCHPQLAFLDSNMYYEVKLLSAVSCFEIFQTQADLY